MPPISLIDNADPLSPQGQLGTVSLFSQPPAYYLIFHELRRYVEGWTGGRSILVAGHRGSGKTTLVHMAIQDLKRLYREEQQPYHILPVALYGPALYVDDDPSKPVDPGTTPASSEAARSKRLTERALTEITNSLYRSLATDLAWRFREHESVKQAADLRELAAQLIMAMDDAPSASLLRECWERAGLIERGVVFGEPQRANLRRNDQGLRELVALSTAALDYRIIAGLRKAALQQQITATQEQTKGLTFSFSSQNSQEIINALLALAAAVLVGAGAQKALVDQPLISAISAVLAGLATLVTLNYSSTRSNKRVQTQEETFVREYSLASLSREMPLLLQRLSDARIAPVFVVDELDKVEQWDRDPGELLKQLKYFITERSFFFFLADRTTYDSLENLSLQTAYPQQHTFFTYHVFMLHRPQDLHHYLLTWMGAEATDLSREVALLPYYLLQNARLHPFDLNREVAKLIKTAGKLDLPEGFPDRFRFSILIQLTVELLLRQPKQDAIIERNPRWGQVLYHALYYPSFCWSTGKPELIVDRQALDEHLTEWLGERVFEEEESQGKLDLDHLLDLTWTLVDWLCRPADLARELQRELQKPLPKDTPQQSRQKAMVVEYLRVVGDSLYWQLFDSIEKSDAGTSREKRCWRLAWRFDQFGSPTGHVSAEETEIAEIQEFISQVDGAIGRITGNMFDLVRLSEAGILPPTPAKPDYDKALTRFQSWLRDPVDHPEPQSDLLLLREYRDLIQKWAEVTALALVLGSAAGVDAGKNGPEAIDAGARALVNILGLRLKERAATSALLRAVADSLRSRGNRSEDLELTYQLDGGAGSSAQSGAAAGIDLELKPGRVDEWERAVTGLLDDVKKAGSEPEAWPAIWWNLWRRRFTRFFREDTTIFPPYWSDVVARAADRPAAAHLNLDLQRMTMGAWSELLLLALKTAVESQPPSVVSWSDPLFRASDPTDPNKTKQDEATWGRILGVVATEAALAWPRSPDRPAWDATAPWLAIPAVERLGLGQQVEKPWREALTTMDYETASWVTGSLGTKRWRERPAIGYGIAASDSSIMKNWPAPVRYGGILLERKRWLEISKSFEAQGSQKAGATKDTSSQCIVLVEPGSAELDESMDENEIRPARRLVEWIGESSSTWVYVVPTAAPEAKRSDRIVIRGPQDFDDAMDRAIKALSGASRI